MTDSEIQQLIAGLGDAQKVTYAPSNIFPMSAPTFVPAGDMDRDEQPEGPIGVYAHVPYCRYKCTFCFYATRPIPAAEEMARYVLALEKELSWLRPGTPLTQLYVGGGTPTALPPELLDRLLAAIFARVVPGDEVNTVECSPDSVSKGHVRVLERRGIERVSMGWQSGSPEIRDRINRRHDDRQVLAASELLVGSGFVVNIDLIYGLPGQTEASFRDDFERAAKLGVHSLTIYNLRVNEKTAVGRLISAEERLDAAALVRWRELARAIARDCGFEQTRWHTYQRIDPLTASEPAARFRDVTGWGNQLGVGVSARSRLNDTVFRNQGKYADYLDCIERNQSPVEDVRPLNEVERRLRFVTLTLGDGRPLQRASYERVFGSSFSEDFADPLQRLVDGGVVSDEGDRLQLTERGKLVYDLATRAFYPEKIRRWIDDRQQLAERSVNLRARAR